MNIQRNTIVKLRDELYGLYKSVSELERTLDTKIDSDYESILSAVSTGNFVVLDTETTGLHQGEIVQIAIVDDKGNTLLNQLIKPVNGIPESASAIHGISDDMVKNSPTFDMVVNSIRGYLAGKTVIVYNANYDRKMLHQSAEAVGIPKTDYKSFSKWVCAMEAFAPIFGEENIRYGGYKWQKLTTAARHYNVNVENAHDALGDCLMTLGIVQAMSKIDKK